MSETDIPESFRDLFARKSFGHLATVMPDGSPQVTPVWVDVDGPFLLVNTAVGRVKDVNMRRRPRVAIEILDPENPMRYLSVRGVVAEVVEGEPAEAHIHKLAQRYMGRPYPDTARLQGEKRILFKIRPTHVHGWDPMAGR